MGLGKHEEILAILCDGMVDDSVNIVWLFHCEVSTRSSRSVSKMTDQK